MNNQVFSVLIQCFFGSLLTIVGTTMAVMLFLADHPRFEVLFFVVVCVGCFLLYRGLRLIPKDCDLVDLVPQLTIAITTGVMIGAFLSFALSVPVLKVMACIICYLLLVFIFYLWMMTTSGDEHRREQD